MNITELEIFLNDINCKYILNESLKKYTSFKIGGPCPILLKPEDVTQISEIVKYCNIHNINYLVLGNGSNVLISDNGFNGIVIHLGSNFSKIKVLENNIIECQSGVSLIKLAKTALDNSLTGVEFAWGIPANVGGAVYMNAGAYDGEMKDIVKKVEFVDLNGNIKILKNADLEFAYRHSFFSNKKYVITRAWFEFKIQDKNIIKHKMDYFMFKRKSKQPLEYPSAGSTFKRPEGAFSAALIEQCGLKGKQIGGAMVSTKHSGFIINFNDAKCKDILELIKFVQKIVLEQTGFELKIEVRKIGEF